MEPSRESSASKGITWDYSLPQSYVIAFLNFPFSVVTGDAKDNKDYSKHYLTCESGSREKMPEADGVPIETIAKYSGLSKEEIRTL